jgi:hypothetical protein
MDESGNILATGGAAWTEIACRKSRLTVKRGIIRQNFIGTTSNLIESRPSKYGALRGDYPE